MNGLPKTGDLFATNQVSPDTERCYRYQLRNFAQWVETEQGKIELEDVTRSRFAGLQSELVPFIAINAETLHGDHQVVLQVGAGIGANSH